MKFEKLKAKAADYSNGVIQAIDVGNFHEILSWMTDVDSFRQRIGLSGDNRDNFRSVFGKPSFCWKGSEFYFKCYLLRLETVMLLVMTAKNKGTCYELVQEYNGDEQSKDIEEVIRFLDWLSKQLPERG